MKTAKVLSLVLFLVMICSNVYGAVFGDVLVEGQMLLSLLWGRLVLVDFYVGMILFISWMIFRKESGWRLLLWIVLCICLGNFSTSLYIYLALRHSGGDWHRFFYGKRVIGH